MNIKYHLRPIEIKGEKTYESCTFNTCYLTLNEAAVERASLRDSTINESIVVIEVGSSSIENIREVFAINRFSHCVIYVVAEFSSAMYKDVCNLFGRLLKPCDGIENTIKFITVVSKNQVNV